MGIPKRAKVKLGILTVITCLTLSSVVIGASNPPKQKVKLPKLPEIWEIHKNLKKEDFQPSLVTSDTEILEALNDPKSTKALRGFVGQNYVTEVDGQSVIVLENSINAAKTGNWQAKGLVRNETTDNVGNVTIEAQLFSKDGKLLDTARTDSLVQNIRPGEPAPFIIKSSKNTDEVSEVKWAVQAKAISENVSREANIMVNYEVPFGKPEYKGILRDDAPYPYVMGTSFDNLSGPVKQADIIVAWLDETGKVVWVENSPLDPAFRNGVGVDGSALFKDIIVEDAEFAPQLSSLSYTLWVVGK